MEKQEDDDTDQDEDEDTAANSKQLAEWEGVPSAGDVEEFDDFDGGIDEGQKGDDGERSAGAAAVFKASPRCVCVCVFL